MTDMAHVVDAVWAKVYEETKAENERLREENRRLIQIAIDTQDALRRALES